MSRTQDPLTYRAPRTLQEAFGPYTSDAIEYEEVEQFDWQDRVVLTGCTAAGFALMVMLLCGWL